MTGISSYKAISALVQILNTSEKYSIYWQVAESLGKIGIGHEKAIAILVQLLQTSQDEITRRLAADNFA